MFLCHVGLLSLRNLPMLHKYSSIKRWRHQINVRVPSHSIRWYHCLSPVKGVLNLQVILVRLLVEIHSMYCHVSSVQALGWLLTWVTKLPTGGYVVLHILCNNIRWQHTITHTGQPLHQRRTPFITGGVSQRLSIKPNRFHNCGATTMYVVLHGLDECPITQVAIIARTL